MKTMKFKWAVIVAILAFMACGNIFISDAAYAQYMTGAEEHNRMVDYRDPISIIWNAPKKDYTKLYLRIFVLFMIFIFPLIILAIAKRIKANKEIKEIEEALMLFNEKRELEIKRILSQKNTETASMGNEDEKEGS